MKALIFALSILLLATLSLNSSLAQDQAPPRSDTITDVQNFLACYGNKFSLCYYSGPDSQPDQPAMPCLLGEKGLQADCKCYSYEDGKQWNYVAIGSILNPEVREQTENACSTDGSNCVNMKTQLKCELSGLLGKGNCKYAPVCDTLGAGGDQPGDQTLYKDLPGDYSISTFSLQHARSYPIGSTSCKKGLYAGCMTAPCQTDPDNSEYANCNCPTYKGVFQIGQSLDEKACFLKKQSDGKNVWSAANLDLSD